MGDSEVESKRNQPRGDGLPSGPGPWAQMRSFNQVGLEETDMITVLNQDGYAINRMQQHLLPELGLSVKPVGDLISRRDRTSKLSRG